VSGLFTLIFSFGFIIVAIVSHEYAHGFLAHRLGDPTPEQTRRLTFDLRQHIDVFGTLIIPLILLSLSGTGFGWAKPVPLNSYYWKNPRRDTICVLSAGIVVNLAAAVFFWVVLKISLPEELQKIFFCAMTANLGMAIMNLIPAPGTDAYRLLSRSLSHEFSRKYLERPRIAVLLTAMYVVSGLFTHALGFIRELSGRLI
jgi:Zn-dependent protease